MALLIPANEKWKASIVCGITSLSFYLMIVIVESMSPKYALNLIYYLGFFFPILFFSISFGISAMIYYSKIDQPYLKSLRRIYQILPVLLLIPQGTRILIVLTKINSAIFPIFY